MAENGNRGPNDSVRRSGRRRREPPIIDVAATEVPLDPAGPAASDTSPVSDPHQLGGKAMAADAAPGVETASPAAEPPRVDPGAVPPATDEVRALSHPAEDEPVLFGNALRDPARRSATADDEAGAPADASGFAGTAEAGARSPEAAPRDAIAGDPAGGGSSPRSWAAPVPSAGSGFNALAGILGVLAVVLLGIIGWLVYSGGQRAHGLAASVADLKTRVATLEARPDSAALRTQVAALDRRLAAADAERSALGKTVATLSSRFDAVGQQVRDAMPAKRPAEAAATPAKSAGTPAETAPTPAFATLGALGALTTKVEGLDSRVAALTKDQSGTAKTMAALPKPVAPDFGPVNGKLAALQSQVDAVDSKINAVDSKTNGSDASLNGFDTKINQIDAKVNSFDRKMNGIDARLNGDEVKVGDGADNVAKLQSTVANLPKVDLGPLKAATAALDGRIVTIEGQLSAQKNGARVTEARVVGRADDTKATPIALVGQSIERAIASGSPYADDVDALKALGAEPDLVAKLEAAAARGVPSTAALKAQWEGMREDVLAAVKPAESGGSSFDRLAANALSIVKVQRVGAVAGNDPRAVVSRIDAALDAGDVPAALAAWNSLPEAGKDRSRGWADAAHGRLDALGAARDLVNHAIATLGRTRT